VYTQAFAGKLQEDAALRAEFLQALNRKGP